MREKLDALLRSPLARRLVLTDQMSALKTLRSSVNEPSPVNLLGAWFGPSAVGGG